MTSIPKTIHYCWFGRKPLPKSAQKCIASWRKYLPDYKIIEWNEDNFDVNAIPYTAQAYAAGKYAFVSDYARMTILYRYGGLYFDTDVELIKPLADIIANGPFMGYEIDPVPKTSSLGYVNPGLCLGAIPGMTLYKKMIDLYHSLTFTFVDGSHNQKTIVCYTTEILKNSGLLPKSGIQTVDGVTIYPKEFFNPLDDATGKLSATRNTRSIHWYSKTWLNVSPWRTRISRISHRLFGITFVSRIRRMLHL